MFYNEKDRTYRIIGVYRLARKKGSVGAQECSFAALSHRIKGECRFSDGANSWEVRRGGTVFLPAGTPFHRECLSDEDIVAIHLQCTGEAVTGIGVENETEALEPLFLRMLEIWEEGGPAAYNRCMALLYTVFERLQALKQPEWTSLPAVIAPGVRLIRARFRDPELTVSEAAGACFISEVYFRRLYRKAFGTSPLQGLLALRFDHARELLSSGYYGTEEAARLSGFSDVKYFRTAFTRRFGRTPAALRREAARGI